MPPFFPPLSLLPLALSELLLLDATFLVRLVLSCLFPCGLCTLSKRSHTHTVVRRVVAWVLVTLCPFSHRAYRHAPDPLGLVRRRPSFHW